METNEKFENRLYEYTTKEFPTDLKFFSNTDKDMNKEGWMRVWADITIESTFVVYRRARK